MSKEARNLLFYLLVFALLLILIRINLMVPLLNEDFDLNASGKTLADLYKSCAGQYLNWNARIGDVLSLILSELPIGVYNFFNALLTLLFIVLVMYLPSISFKKTSIKRPSVLIITFLLLIFLVNRPGEIYLWRTGSANYLHPTLLVLLFITPVLMLLVRNEDIFTKVKIKSLRLCFIFVYVLSGIVVGHANENTSPALVLFLVLAMIVEFKKTKKIKWWLLGSAILVFWGAVLLLFGPSTTHRIEVYSQIFGVKPSPINLFLSNFSKTLMIFFALAKNVLIFAVIVYFLIDRQLRRAFLRETSVYFSFALVAALILAAAPYQEPRAFFISSVLLIFIVLKSIYFLPEHWEKVLIFAALIGFFVAWPTLAKEYNNMKVRYKYQNKRIATVLANLNTEGDIIVPKMPIKSSLLVLVGGTDDESVRMGHYFNLKNRKIINAKSK